MLYETTGSAAKETEEPDAGGIPARFDALKTYLSEISRYPVMTREEEHEVSVLVFEHQDQDAARELATANLRLVVKIALQYYNTYLNLLDLIQEGNVGMLRAVQKYNPYKGSKFSSYAAFWIRAYMLKYIMDSWSIVKIGTTQGQRKLFYSLKKEIRSLEALGIYPESGIIALALQVKEDEVDEMKRRVSSHDVSLDMPVGPDSEDTVMDMLHSDEDVQETVSWKEECELLSQSVMHFRQTLKERALFVFDQRIMCDEPRTLQEIASVFNISRERVRQIENGIRRKLKDHFIAHNANVISPMPG